MNELVYKGGMCVVGEGEVIDRSLMAAVSEIFETGKDIDSVFGTSFIGIE